jgi:hypothetical protein
LRRRLGRTIPSAHASEDRSRLFGVGELAQGALRGVLGHIDEAMGKLEVGQRSARGLDLDAFRKGLAQDMTAMSK